MIRRLLRGVAWMAFAGLLLAFAAASLAAEIQIPFDAAGRVQRIDEPLARRLGLFLDEYPGFQEARLFSADDSSFVLEVSLSRGGQFVREREPLTRAQADSLRADVSQRLALTEPRTPRAERVEQGGRATLVTSWTLMGLGFYGWAVPYITDMQDGSAVLGTYMLVSGTSFLAPFLLTRHQPVTWGPTNLSLYGTTRGVVHGWLISEIAKPEGGYDDDGRTAIALAAATSVGEGILGYAIGQKQTAGSAGAIEVGGDFGMAWGFLASDLAGFVDRDEDRTTATLVLGSSVAGMAAGGWLAGRRAYSYGDGMLVRVGGYAGTLVGTAFADVGDPEESEAYSAGILAGSALGLWAGDRLVHGREFTVGEGMLVQLGWIAGGLTGLGIVALTQTDDSAPYWFGTATGGILGYTLTYMQLSPKATARASQRTSWRFDLAPEGLLAAAGRAPAGAPPPTFARVRLTF